jgi:hypothetical protein
MSPLSAFQWVANTGVGVAVRKSTYAFPVVEVVHLLGLTLLLGVVLTLDLRLLGLGPRRQNAAVLASDLAPAFWSGLTLTLLSGAILFIGEPIKCFYNGAFWWKMSLLAGALVIQSVLFHRLRGVGSSAPGLQKAIAGLSLALWLSVGVAGRVIGFI